MSRQFKAIETILASLNHSSLNNWGTCHIYSMSHQMKTVLAVHIARQLESDGLFRFQEQGAAPLVSARHGKLPRERFNTDLREAKRT